MTFQTKTLISLLLWLAYVWAGIILTLSPVAAAEQDDVRQNKTFISEGICEYTDGQRARCTLWFDSNDPGYHYLAIYSNKKLIVIKRMPVGEFDKAENVWVNEELGI